MPNCTTKAKKKQRNICVSANTTDRNFFLLLTRVFIAIFGQAQLVRSFFCI